MRRRLIFLLGIFGLIGLVIWQLPTLLKAIPSRYVAAYFPEDIQEMAARDHVEILPTAQQTINVATLFEGEISLTPSRIDTAEAPLANTPTLTPSEQTDSYSDDNLLTNTPTANLVNTGPTSTPVPSPIPIPVDSRLGPVRHHFQTWNNCGPATLAMALSYFDIYLTQEQTAKGLKPDPEDRNVSPYEMANFVNTETDLMAMELANGNLATLKRLVAQGLPVIVELGLDPPGEYRWMGWYGHYLLVVAYDDSFESVWVYDSWFGTSEQPGVNADDQGRQISYTDLDRYWRQFNRNYIVLYRADRTRQLEQILGSNLDVQSMWHASLNRVKDELVTDASNPFLWFNLGTTYNALGEYEKAATAFDQARSIGLPWRMLWYQFGPYEAYYQIGRYDDMFLLADITLMDRPYFEEAFYYRGLALEALGDIDQAKKDFKKAADFNPFYLPASEALARLESD